MTPPFPLKQRSWFSIHSSFKLEKTANFANTEIAMFLGENIICKNSVISQAPLKLLKESYELTLFDMGFFEPSIMGDGRRPSPIITLLLLFQ